MTLYPARTPANLDDADGFDEAEVQMEVGYPNCIVVDNIPVIGQEKFAKLETVIFKIFSNIGPIRDNKICVPVDPETQMTKGFAFIEFFDAKTAASAIEKLNGYKLDKSHIFTVNHYEDFERFTEVPEEYIPPQPKPYEEPENLLWWLVDEEHLTSDQFAIRLGDDTEISWNYPKKPESVIKKKKWTDSYIAWSPLGTYLVTFHVQGIILWGGKSWKKIKRFQHPGVKVIDFSPKENYLVTMSSQQDPENTKDPQAVIIWDIRSGQKLGGFPGGENIWPLYKWSFDDKYFARLGKGMISVYEAPSMNLLEKKSIKINEVKDFCWSPAANIISCWIPESGNSPARVMLIEIPSKKEKRQKNLFSVNDCKMHWQNRGEYLCVKVDRNTKSKKSKSTFTNFELFRLGEKDVPVEVFEVKASLIAFAWEPNGSRFAIIHTSSDSASRYDVSFYSVEGNQTKLLKTLEKRAANFLFWSPKGNFIVLAGLKNLNGALEFFNVNEMQTMGVAEHYGATEVEWDPSGRFIGTCSSAWRTQWETGYCIWSFQGKLLYKLLKERFYSFYWRPRPPSLLSEEQDREIKNNLRQYSIKYREEERKNKSENRNIAKQKREAMRKEFEDFVAQRKKELEEERAHLKMKLKETDEQDYETIVNEVEEELETVVEVLE